MVITCNVNDNNEIHIIVEDAAGLTSAEVGKMVQTGLKEKLTKFVDTVVDKLSLIIPFVANKIRASVDNITPKPSELSCEMGIEFSGEENVFIIKAVEKADIRCTLTWKNL